MPRKLLPFPRVMLVLLGSALICLGSCSPTALEKDYGRSVSHNMAEQMLYPPGTFATPPVGRDPKTAETVYESYHKSFKGKEKQERPPSVLIQMPIQ